MQGEIERIHPQRAIEVAFGRPRRRRIEETREARGGPQALARIKDLIRAVSSGRVDDAMIADTAQRIAEIRVSPEGREGIASFLEKRRPAWAGGEPAAEKK